MVGAVEGMLRLLVVNDEKLPKSPDTFNYLFKLAHLLQVAQPFAPVPAPV
jgi:hypothetical protein